jgi:hypothetical protein
MAQPPGRGLLRPAADHGLTSPAPVRTPRRKATRTPPPTRNLWTSRAKGERQGDYAPLHLAKLLVQQSGRKRATRN